MGVTSINIMAEATADDDEIPKGQCVEGGEKMTQGGFLGTHKNSSGDYKEIEQTIIVVIALDPDAVSSLSYNTGPKPTRPK